MSNKDVGGADDSQAGGKADDKAKDVVSYATYSKTMDELKTLQKELKDIKDRDSKANEDKLKETNDWKALAEAKEKQLLDKAQELDSVKGSITESIKLNAFQKALGGKLKNDRYFDFVDVEKIVYNPETKKVDAESVKSVVADFVKNHAALIDYGKKATMPQRAAGGMNTGTDAAKKTIDGMSRDQLNAHILKMAELGKIK